MKKSSKHLILNSLIFFSVFFFSVKCKSQCVSGSVVTPAPIGSTVESINGYYAPTSGTYRALIIFAEVIYSPSTDDPNPAGNSSWLPGVLPTWANDVFNVNAGSLPLKSMTKYFDQASSGQLKLFGDVLINPNNPTGIFQVPVATSIALSGTSCYSLLLNEVNSSTGGVFATLNNLNQSDFNAWSPTAPGSPKLFPGIENKHDIVFVIWRNRPKYDNDGRTWNGLSSPLFGRGVNVIVETGSFGELPMIAMRHEFCHSLFGADNMHTAGEQGYANDYWVSWPGGYGAMGLHGVSLLTWNGWDRQRLGWKPASNTFNPSARNATNTSEVDGSIDPLVPAQAGEYILRDFVTTGDALKIKLPFINATTKYPEYLWIENHQGISRNGSEFDQFQHHSESCITPFEPGLFMQLQIDQDTRSSNTVDATSEVFYNGKAFYTYPITAEGFYDEEWETSTQTISCVSWLQTQPFIRNVNLPNPLSGTGDQQNPANDFVLDDKINNDEKNLHEVEKVGGVYQYNLPYLGHSRSEFSLSVNHKLGISTNPSSASLMSMTSYNWPAPTDTKNNESVYLNGVSIEIITEYANGDIKVRIRFDDVDISNDVRWCAPTITLNPISSSSGYSLNVKNGKKVTLDQGLTSTRIDLPMMFNGKKVFSSPTSFITSSGANINLEPNSKLIIDNGSQFFLKSNSILNIQNGAEVRVKRGSRLLLESGSKIQLENGARVIIEGDGFVEYSQGAEIRLNGSNSVMEIDGQLKLNDNSIFTFLPTTGSHGYFLFGSSLSPSRNIVAGLNCSIDLRSSSSNNKILEIVQETFYAPDNLIQLKLNSGKVVLHPNSRLQPDGLATNVEFNNVRFTSNTPGSFNGHRGVHLYGQQNISISTCTFEYGTYGIFSYQTYGGAPLNLLGCVFRHNEIGIRAYDKGLGLYQCNFFNNSWGVMANEMSFPSTFIDGLIGGGVVNSNSTGISWQGYATPGLWLDNPYINTNSIGVSSHGSPLIVRCGSISYNTDGILLTHGADLLMDDQWGGPAGVTVFNNYYSIRAAGGKELFLNNGSNDLSPANPNSFKSVFGNLYRLNSSIPAESNKWNVSGTFSTNDYSLTGYGGSIPLTDGSPLTSILGCGQAIPPCPTPPCTNQSPLENCPNCDVINTDDFLGVKLNIATKDAIAMLNSTTPGKYKKALELFYQILKEIYNNPDDKEKYLLGLNYIKMMEALGNAYKFGEINCGSTEPNPDPGAPVGIESLPESVLQVISILDNLILKADQDGNYNLRFKYSMDKAQVLRLACKREDCINLLNEMLNWASGEEVHDINKFICEVNLEILVINGSVKIEEISEMLATCNSGSGRVRDLSETTGSLEKLQPPVVYLSVDIYQADRSSGIDIKTNAQFAHMVVMNSIGELIIETDINYDSNINSEVLSAGMYIVNITNSQNGESFGKKFVIE